MYTHTYSIGALKRKTRLNFQLRIFPLQSCVHRIFYPQRLTSNPSLAAALSFINTFFLSFISSFIITFILSFISSFVNTFILSFISSFINTFILSFTSSFVNALYFPSCGNWTKFKSLQSSHLLWIPLYLLTYLKYKESEAKAPFCFFAELIF